MARRIEVELTSTRDDGTWTWRAAGARQPKGSLDGSLLPPGAKVGDVVRADAEFALDGITILSVLPPKEARPEPERLEVTGSRRFEGGVTTQLAPTGRSGRREREGERGDGRGPRDRADRGLRPSRGERADRGPRRDARPSGSSGDRRPERAERRPRKDRPAPPPRPRSKRLKAGRAHRNALLASVPEQHRPLTEQLLRGGIPAVRQAVERFNTALRAEGRPTLAEGPLLDVAEALMNHVRLAEWRDRADAALAGADEIDLRDLRSVVVAADGVARDDETRALSAQLRDALNRRVEVEQREWLREITENLDEGRTIRALRLSSRPPKAGTPFPADLAARLASATAEALSADTGPERYATILEALALSPVRLQVTPVGVPERPGEALLAAVRQHADKLPQVAGAFGLTPTTPTT